MPKNRCRTTIAERVMEKLAELPLTGDQMVCLSHELGRLQRNAIPRAELDHRPPVHKRNRIERMKDIKSV
jgi:hypothetical protein